MRFYCHLSFDGRCEEAFRFYHRLFGGQFPTLLRYGESPMAGQVPKEWQQKVIHATLVIDDQELLGNDAFPNAFERPQGFAVTLGGMQDPVKARELFNALAEGGRIALPFQETFWSAGYGVLTDRFGIPWEVNCERPAP